MNLRQRILIGTIAIILPILSGCRAPCPVTSMFGTNKEQKTHLKSLHQEYGTEITVAELKDHYSWYYQHHKSFKKKVLGGIDHAYLKKEKRNLNDEVSDCEILETDYLVQKGWKINKHLKKKFPNYIR